MNRANEGLLGENTYLTSNNFGIDTCKQYNPWLRDVLVKLSLESYSTIIKHTDTDIDIPDAI